MFAVMLPQSSSAIILDATPTRSHRTTQLGDVSPQAFHPSYTVTPHRIGQKDPLPSFIIPDRPANLYMPHVTLLKPDHIVIYSGECRPSELSIYSVYFPEPVPLFVFSGGDHIRWPNIGDNVLRIGPGDRAAYRFWIRRWDPDAVHDAYVTIRDGPSTPPARPAPTQTATATATSTATPLASATALPSFVADALIQAAVTANATCPITMEPITAGSARVTPCYHVFEITALTSWCAAGNKTCPTCKQASLDVM
jgi:hypothetical protein